MNHYAVLTTSRIEDLRTEVSGLVSEIQSEIVELYGDEPTICELIDECHTKLVSAIERAVEQITEAV